MIFQLDAHCTPWARGLGLWWTVLSWIELDLINSTLPLPVNLLFPFPPSKVFIVILTLYSWLNKLQFFPANPFFSIFLLSSQLFRIIHVFRIHQRSQLVCQNHVPLIRWCVIYQICRACFTLINWFPPPQSFRYKCVLLCKWCQLAKTEEVENIFLQKH